MNIRSKYYSKKVEYDGIVFDSKKEAEYYKKLKQDEADGIIKDLELQKEYVLQDSFKLGKKTIRKISYKADFTFKTIQDDRLHVVDVKGSKKILTEVFKIKKKMFEYKYGFEIELVI